MNVQTIASLVERRRLLAADLDKAQGHVQQLHADIASLDAVIRQYDPEYDVGSLRPKYRRQATTAETGAMSRAVLDTLRRAGGPQGTKEIAAKITAERGLNAADTALRRNMVKRVGMALRYQRMNGMVEEVVEGAVAGMWKIL